MLKRLSLITALLASCLFAQTATLTVSKDQPASSVAASPELVALQSQVKDLQAQVSALQAQLSTLRVTSVGVPAAPYEAAAVAVIQFAQSIIDSQPPEVRQELWRMHLEDMKRWQAFWAALRGGLGDAFKASAK